MTDKPTDNEILNLYMGDIDFANKRIGKLKEALAASKKREEELENELSEQRLYKQAAIDEMNKRVAYCRHADHKDSIQLCSGCHAHEVGSLQKKLQAKDAEIAGLRMALGEAKELMPKPCEHFAFHGAMEELIEDALCKSPSASLEELKTDTIFLRSELSRLVHDLSSYLDGKGPHPILESDLKFCREALDKTYADGLEELKTQIRREAADALKARADSLYAWMEKEPIHSEKRKELSLRAGELYEAERIVRSLSPAPGEKKACGCDKDVRNPFCTHPLHGSGEKAGGEA